ncbi:hypothetical protein M3Y99_01280400 [Aphelenchoides fujianensis]|nr:hypothetical protein M3Y99_01280400 [Aphelenchoides fujianensis]
MPRSKRGARRPPAAVEEDETCCRHGRPCGFSAAATPPAKPETTASSAASIAYMEGGHRASDEDARTVFENAPHTPAATPSLSWISPLQPKKPAETKAAPGGFLDRLYLGCLTEADARAKVADGAPLALFHALPVSHGHLRRKVRKGGGACITLTVQLLLLHRKPDGKFVKFPIKSTALGVFVDMGGEGAEPAVFRSVEKLGRYHFKFLTGKSVLDEEEE